MLYFVATTTVCDLKCVYCQNEPDPSIEPILPQFTIDKLKQFISQDKDATIAFYGGEPLLNVEFIKRVMDEIPAKRYIMQTSGMNLNKLDSRYLSRFDTILVSIDGRPEITDFYRGKGVYERIMENIRYIRENGFRGDLIARMAVSYKTDIYLDAKHLAELKDPGFDHVHWQLDALWDTPPATRYGGLKGFAKWVKESYNPGITKLISYWLDKMREGEVIGFVPFQGIMKSLLLKEKNYLRCGSGIDSFTVTTSGRILACPIAPEFDFNVIGNIYRDKPQDLPWRVTVDGPCNSCEVFDICGGRCLFANKTMLWGTKGFELVCDTVKHLILSLKRIQRQVEDLLERGIVSWNDLIYPKYNNTTEIIP